MKTKKSEELLTILDDVIEQLKGDIELTANNKAELLLKLSAARQAIKDEPNEKKRWEIIERTFIMIFKIGTVVYEYWKSRK